MYIPNSSRHQRNKNRHNQMPSALMASHKLQSISWPCGMCLCECECGKSNGTHIPNAGACFKWFRVLKHHEKLYIICWIISNVQLERVVLSQVYNIFLCVHEPAQEKKCELHTCRQWIMDSIKYTWHFLQSVASSELCHSFLFLCAIFFFFLATHHYSSFRYYSPGTTFFFSLSVKWLFHRD